MAWWDGKPDNPDKQPERTLFEQAGDSLSPFLGTRQQENPALSWIPRPKEEPVRSGIPGDRKDDVRDRLARGEYVPDWEMWAAGIQPDREPER